jgi:hypothetical protein
MNTPFWMVPGLLRVAVQAMLGPSIASSVDASTRLLIVAGATSVIAIVLLARTVSMPPTVWTTSSSKTAAPGTSVPAPFPEFDADATNVMSQLPPGRVAGVPAQFRSVLAEASRDAAPCTIKPRIDTPSIGEPEFPMVTLPFTEGPSMLSVLLES